MLVLTRRRNQAIVIDDHVEISVLAVVGDKVRLGIQAPRHVSVLRKEVYTRLHEADAGEGGEPDAAGPVGGEQAEPTDGN